MRATTIAFGLLLLGCVAQLATADMGADMLALVNQARRSAGARPLQYSQEMQAAALRHSRDIARTGRMGHTGSDGSGLGDRIWPMADRMQGCRRSLVGENVAPGSPSSPAKYYFDMWMKSDGHRMILNPSYTHMGVAVASGKATFATQVFHQCK